MTCVECGAQLGKSPRCGRCGAPVGGNPGEAWDIQTIGQTAAKRLGGCVAGIVLGAVNVIATWLAVAGLVAYATQGTPAEEGQQYIPLWAALFLAIVSVSIPVFTVAFLIRRRARRAGERREQGVEYPLTAPR